MPAAGEFAGVIDPQVRRFLEQARVGRLATVDAAGAPSVIPICYQIAGARLFTPLDEKPKRVDYGNLRRVRNLRARPEAAVVVDRWDEDWRRLGWVHLRGRAEVVEPGELHRQAVPLLREKYPQYREMALEDRPLIVMTIASVRHWGDLSLPPG